MSESGAQSNNGGRRKAPPCHAAIVRRVPSGDTLYLLDPDSSRNGGAPKEIQLTLLGLKAPILGRRYLKEGNPVQDKDERWAWESREFLRKQLIGKSVVYRIEHEAGARAYGEVWLNKENIRFTIAREGWADVVVKAKKDGELRVEDQELEELRNEAKEAGRGIWSSGKGGFRHVVYREFVRGGKSDDLFDFFERNKNKALPAVVDQVRSGSTLRLLLTKTMDNIVLLLAGVRSPAYNGNEDASTEPCAREAKFLTEHLLLDRDVTVTIEGIDKYDNFFGTVLDSEILNGLFYRLCLTLHTHMKGRNISVNLLRMGLAQFVEWSASPKVDSAAFREAEKHAQESKVGIWRDYKPLPAQGGKKTSNDKNNSETFSAKVVEVVNAGTITVRVNKGERGDLERKLSFASISVPRLLSRADKDDDELTDAQRLKLEEDRRLSSIAWEGREFLRKQLIGKTVRCVFDYMRPAITPKSGSNDKPLPPKPFYSIYVKDHNVAVDLVTKGFATVVSHGPNEPRSQDFQALIIAEKQAQKAASGVHAPKSSVSAFSLNDLTQQNATKSQTFLGTLKRAGTINAVVDYVFTATRLKLFVPSERLLICFALQGIQGEKVVKAQLSAADKGKTSDLPLTKVYPPSSGPGNAGLHLTRDNIFQRDVKIEVDSLDKGGNFIGTLYFNGRPYGTELLSQGLAKGSAQRLKEYPRLQAAEDEAKAGRLGVWADYDPAEEARRAAEANAAREAARSAQAEAAKIQVTITEIEDASRFWYQVVGEETQALESLMANFRQQDFRSQDPYQPKQRGELVAGRFTMDDDWYRAEVQKIVTNDDGNTQYNLLYVDYGNVESVSADRIRKLTPDFALSVLPRLAHRGTLAYVRPPPLSSEFGVDAAAKLKELVWDKNLLATVQFRDGHGSDEVNCLLLGDVETKTPINALLVSLGLARVQKSRSKNALYERLLEEQETARRSRLNIWQYGDVPDSDEERDDRRR